MKIKNLALVKGKGILKIKEGGQAMEKKRMEKLLKDLIYLNGVIATELIQITENTSAAIRGGIPESCKKAHNALRNDILKILGEEAPALVENLRNHLTGH